ncbi:hypothetical protein [Neobacillus citreus]|uniref:Uncharacterized protein n=1 Tax=Neobacillus citreus TaxID=2833578 RepID=A0A942T3C8_9BACI|nr:hypothetical protein [Neobacillus citreus]MCH6268446.1 hypothetical protein [Neobacillus citreus]
MPNQNYNVTVEACYNGNLIARGSTGFTTPYMGGYDDANFETREMFVTSINDKSLTVDRMVITRTAVIVENRELYEDTSTAKVVHDGAPIETYTGTEFKEGNRKYIYHVVNYQNGSMVGKVIFQFRTIYIINKKG